jgi:hypothetical protein
MSQEIRTVRLQGVLHVEDDPRHRKAQEIYSNHHPVRATFTPRPDGDFDVEILEQSFVGEMDRLREENARLLAKLEKAYAEIRDIQDRPIYTGDVANNRIEALEAENDRLSRELVEARRSRLRLPPGGEIVTVDAEGNLIAEEPNHPVTISLSLLPEDRREHPREPHWKGCAALYGDGPCTCREPIGEDHED